MPKEIEIDDLPGSEGCWWKESQKELRLLTCSQVKGKLLVLLQDINDGYCIAGIPCLADGLFIDADGTGTGWHRTLEEATIEYMRILSQL